MFKGMQMYEVQNKAPQPKLYNFDPSDGVNTKVSISDSKGYIEFGAKDSFPNFLLDSVDGSHTASSCIDTLNTFIKGSGFEQESLGKIKINPEQTFSELHNGISQDEGYFEGFYINVRYNPLGKISYINKLPFDLCRLGKPNEEGKISSIYYNPYFGTSDYKEDETIIFPIYNPNTPLDEIKDIIELNKELEEDEQLEYRGQVLFVKEQRPQNKFYPIPYYWSGYRYFEIERKVGQFHNENLDNGFFLGGIIKMVGDPNEAFETKLNSDGEEVTVKTVGEAFNDRMSEQFSGSSKSGILMALWSDLKDEFPEIEPFPVNSNNDTFITLQNLVVDNIPIAYNVPPVIANIKTAGQLGVSQEISNAVALVNGKTEGRRTKLEGVYDELFSNSIWDSQVEPVEIIPFEYKLTDPLAIKEDVIVEEKKKVDTEETTDIPEVAAPEVVEEKLQKETSFNGAQITSALEIVQSVSEGTLSFEQGVTALMEFLRLDKETSTKLLTK